MRKVINEGHYENTKAIETGSDILNLIEECKENLQKIGYRINDDVKFVLFDDENNFGYTDWPRNDYNRLDRNGKWTIGINRAHIGDAKEKVCDTIYHEFAHYLSNKTMMQTGEIYWKGNLIYSKYQRFPAHGALWKSIASHISSSLRLPKPLDTYGKIEKGDGMYREPTEKYKYLIRCKNCGAVNKYQRMTQFVKDIMDTPSGPNCRWRCGCGSKDWEVL